MADILCVEDLSVFVGSFRLKNISFRVSEDEVFVILGPSGAGKTLLLETIAGFHKVTGGRILICGKDVTRAPPYRRGLSLIFQDYALFPHLTVRENILFGTRYRSGVHISENLSHLTNLLEIQGLLDRMPATLSGGEAQRVALARALLCQPKVLLSDEPFTALDAPMRQKLRAQFLQTIRGLKQAVLFVTHDRNEAYQLATKVAVMDDGRILQIGGKEEIFYKPQSTDIAEFLGVETLLEGVVEEHKDGLLKIRVGDSIISALGERRVGEKVTLCLRADRVSLEMDEDAARSTIRNRFNGVVREIHTEGPVAYVIVDCGFKVTAAVTRLSVEELGIKENSTVFLSFKATSIHTF